MSKRGAGVSFCFIAAFLMAVRNLSAAIWGSNTTSWGSEWFDNMLHYTGGPLLTFSILSLLTGIVYLVVAELEELKKK